MIEGVDKGGIAGGPGLKLGPQFNAGVMYIQLQMLEAATKTGGERGSDLSVKKTSTQR